LVDRATTARTAARATDTEVRTRGRLRKGIAAERAEVRVAYAVAAAAAFHEKSEVK
jgi:hypothetical protein